jgi:Ca-activated chloride channel family protein
MITLAHPWALLLLLVLPPLGWYWSRRGARPVLRFPHVATLAAAGGQWRRHLRLILPVARTVALAALIVALARPQRVDAASQLYAEGIAIQMVLDTSGSMTGRDMGTRSDPVTRLELVKRVFREFVAGNGKDLPGRPNDLIGFIRFARYADSAVPLTLDRPNLLEVLDQTEAVRTRDEDGTAIGDALALAVARLKDLHRTRGSGAQLTITSRIIVLLTDGENNRGDITPEQAGDLAAACGLKVYTIMAGRGELTGFGPMPVDDAPLRHIAEVTGGKHFRAETPGALHQVYAEIDKLERSRTEERQFVSRDERAWQWLATALAALALQTVFGATWLRRLP